MSGYFFAINTHGAFNDLAGGLNSTLNLKDQKFSKTNVKSKCPVLLALYLKHDI